MLSSETIRILARRGRIELLRTLRAYPDRDFTVNELARFSGIAPMTTWRAVAELKRAGFVRTRRVGNAMIVRITEDRDALRILRLVPEADPQRSAAKAFAELLRELPWPRECRLFGSISRGEHAPGDEVDVAVVYDDSMVSELEARKTTSEIAQRVKADTNVTIVPLCVAARDMARKGGIAAELRDKEIVWQR